MAVEKTKRAIDKMGRVVIPNDIRKITGLKIGDEVSFEISGSGILLTPVTKHCAFCGAKHELVEYYDKHICKSCLKAIRLL